MARAQLFKSGDRGYLRFWRRLPVLVRALLAASAVAIAGIQVWRQLISINLAVSPRIPWAAAAMAVYLWLYWSYLNGRGWPLSTAEDRQRNLRAHSLPPVIWRWALVAGGSFIAATAPLTLILGRFFPPTRTALDLLQRLPPLTLFSFLLMSSVVAGVVEEAAFRGYLQSPIERRHGPLMAILITSAVFVLAHLPGRSSVSPSDLLIVSLASFNYGILAYLTNSILPGLVLHASGDAASFGFHWWFEMTLGPRQWRRVSLPEALGDWRFLANCLEVIFLLTISAWAFRRLARRLRANAALGTAAEAVRMSR